MSDLVAISARGCRAGCYWRSPSILPLSICLCFFFLVYLRPVHAQTDIYLPQRFDKPKGGPVTYTDTFETVSTADNYVLWVQSGENGLQEVKNVTVSLNGADIITSRDLRASNPASKAITVQAFNTLAATLKGQGGNHITVKVMCVTCPSVQVTINSPAEGATNASPYVMVRGTIEAVAETGVVVNGVMAQVAGNQFIANHVPLDQGENTITAKATSSYGGIVITSVKINNQPPAQYITLTSNAESGLSPLEVTLKADAELANPIDSVSLVHSGPSTPSISDISQTEYKVLMTAPGLYTYTLVITDSQGYSYEDSIGIAVLSRDEVDILLRGKWDAMKAALTAQDIQKASIFFSSRSKEKYAGIFSALRESLPQIGQNMQNIGMIYLRRDSAKYRIRKAESAGEITYYIYFIRDENGLWKIQQL